MYIYLWLHSIIISEYKQEFEGLACVYVRERGREGVREKERTGGGREGGNQREIEREQERRIIIVPFTCRLRKLDTFFKFARRSLTCFGSDRS